MIYKIYDECGTNYYVEAKSQKEAFDIVIAEISKFDDTVSKSDLELLDKGSIIVENL